MRQIRISAAIVTLLLTVVALSSNAASARPATARDDHRVGVLAWSRLDNFEDGTAATVMTTTFLAIPPDPAAAKRTA